MAEEATQNKSDSAPSGAQNSAPPAQTSDRKPDERRSSDRPTSSYNREGGRRQSGGNFRRGGFRPRRKVCAFCTDKSRVIDWKDVNGLRRFVDDNGSIRARRKTGTCAKHQRKLAVAVKRARQIALLPFTGEHTRLVRKS